MRDGARTTYISGADIVHAIRTQTAHMTQCHTHTPTTRSMSLRVFGICAQLASQRRRLSKRRVAMAVEAVEAYLSEHHCQVSWHITLNNHASTRPKSYGGPLVRAVTACKSYTHVAPDSPLAGNAVWTHPTALRPTTAAGSRQRAMAARKMKRLSTLAVRRWRTF